MRSFFLHQDGRLKTDRVSMVIFALFLLGGAALFRLSRPVEQTLVKVRHIFEPAPQVPIETTGNEPAQDAPAPVPPAATSSGAIARGAPGITEKPAIAVPASGAQSTAEHLVSSETIHEEAAPPPESSANPDPNASKPATPADVRSDPLGPEANDASPAVEKTVASPAITTGGPSDKPVKKETAEAALSEIKAAADTVTSGEPEQASADRQSAEAMHGDPPARKQPDTSPETLDSRHPAPGQLVLEPSDYQRVFAHWRTLGTASEGVPDIPLRVSNLKSVHRLFQMKPVAVLPGGKYVDLSDGTRIPEASLDAYSQTVFRVDAPWAKWGSELKAAGISRKQVEEVRYYMYDFVRNAMFLRARQSVAWERRQGRIPAETAEQEVDVLGRAFELSRKGGGRFGVFVPISLTLKNGRTVPVDPLCFKGEADVDALRTAGLF